MRMVAQTAFSAKTADFTAVGPIPIVFQRFGLRYDAVSICLNQFPRFTAITEW
jgi:hypothetical protein